MQVMYLAYSQGDRIFEWWGNFKYYKGSFNGTLIKKELFEMDCEPEFEDDALVYFEDYMLPAIRVKIDETEE